MKKILLYSFFVFSISAFAQNKQKVHLLNFSGSTLYENIRNSSGDVNRESHEMFFGKNSEHTFKSQTATADSLLQVVSIYHWKMESGWKINSRDTVFIYNTSNNQISYLTQFWNEGTWKNSRQYTATYDNNNNITSELYQIWQSATTLENLERYLYLYDGNNNRINEIQQRWVVNHGWINLRQIISTYDNDHNQTSEIIQDWNSYDWQNYWEYIRVFDSNNNKTSELTRYWTGKTWENSGKSIYTFDITNKLKSGLYQGWFNDTWEDRMRFIYTYDANNNLINEMAQDFFNNVWQNSFQYINTYDENHKKTNVLVQTWNGTNWNNSCQYIYAYDANNLLISDSYKYWTYPANGYPVFISGDSTYYHYNMVITGVSSLTDGSITIYPNPGSGKFTIESNNAIKSVEIYNILGKHVYTDFKSSPQYSKELNLTNSPKGIYIIKLCSGGKIYFGNVMIL